MAYTNRLEALNAIATCIGGEGGHESELAAWTEIEGIGLGYDPLTDDNLSLYYSSRSGNLLLETKSGSNRNAQIMPRVAVASGNKWLNFGATYNPSPAVVTIYFAIKRDGTTSGTATVLSTAATSAPYGLFCDIQKSTGKLGTYTTSAVLSNTHFAPLGEWVRVMYRFTLGNGGKMEIATNGSAFETLVASYNFPSSFIQGNGVLTVAGYQGAGGTGANYFTGEMSEVKIWESSKGWDDVDTDPDCWIPLAGNIYYEYLMAGDTKIAASWGFATYRFAYHKYGSKYWADKGYEIWKKDSYSSPVTHWTPKDCVTTELLAGDWVKIKTYNGSASGFNFFDSYIDFDPTASEHSDLDIWDRDNETIHNSYARVNYTLAGYIHQYYTDKPYYWHSDEINRVHLKNYRNTGYKNTSFPKATTNSMGFNSRTLLSEILVMADADSTKTAKVETYTGDKLINAGVSFNFDDYSRDLTRLTNMTANDTKWWQRFFWRYSYYIDVASETDLTDHEAELQAIIDKGHEIANHTKDHPDWLEYVNTYGAAAFVTDQILPVQTYINNVFGFSPVGFGYPASMGYNETVNALLYANGFEFVRPGWNWQGHTMRECHYVVGSKEVIMYGWYYYENTEEDLLAELAYAKENGTVFLPGFHAVSAIVSGSTVSYEILENMIQYILDNNMQFYLTKELPSL